MKSTFATIKKSLDESEKKKKEKKMKEKQILGEMMDMAA